jgi:hypothetical protein
VPTGTYIGPINCLKGQRALLQLAGSHVLAQFNEVATGLGIGWHHFITADFIVDKPKPDLAVLSEAFADIGLKLHPKHTPREPSGYYVRDVQDTAPDGREVAKCVNLQRGLGDTEGGEFMFDKNGKFLAYGLY